MCDADWASVLSLLHFNGSGNPVATVDAKGTATWTNTHQGSTLLKYGAGAGEFGSPDAKCISTDVADIGTGDFTIDCWMYSSGAGQNRYLWDFRESSADVNAMCIGAFSFSNFLQVYHSGTAKITSTVDVFDSAWHHIALVRSGATVTLYIDGVADGTFAASGVDFQVGTTGTAEGWVWGGYSVSTTKLPLNGYIDDARITQAARWTTGFTPPSAEAGEACAGSIVKSTRRTGRRLFAI